MNDLDTIQQNAIKHIIKNKYWDLYLKIIAKAKSEDRKKYKREYFENHHVLPKSKKLFPEYTDLKINPWNSVLLTVKEHFICHKLIIKFLEGQQKHSMIYALKRMAHGVGYENSRYYTYARTEFLKINRGDTHPSTGTKLSLETRAKMSASGKGRKFSEEHKRKIGEASSKQVFSDATKAKMSASAKGKIISSETRSKLSDLNKGTGNAMSGSKWVYHPIKLLSKPLKPQEVQVYLDAGWLLGQRKYEDQTGRKRGICKSTHIIPV